MNYETRRDLRAMLDIAKRAMDCRYDWLRLVTRVVCIAQDDGGWWLRKAAWLAGKALAVSWAAYRVKARLLRRLCREFETAVAKEGGAV